MTVIGFHDDVFLVRAVAKRLHAQAQIAEVFRYRAGEIAVHGPSHAGKHCVVVADIAEDPHTIFRAGALAEALRDVGARRVDLVAPWIAYGRQDRPTFRGEAAPGVVVGKMLALAFDRIITLDAHSSMFMKSFQGKLVNVFPPASSMPGRPSCVAAPDRGATERAKHVAKTLALPLVIIEKKRVKGHVVASRLTAKENELKGAYVLLIDDIADSGATLRNAMCVLKVGGASRVSAFVTHAMDLEHLRHANKGRFERIDAAYDHAGGKISSEAISALAAQARQA